jgi:hypothetical protein
MQIIPNKRMSLAVTLSQVLFYSGASFAMTSPCEGLDGKQNTLIVKIEAFFKDKVEREDLKASPEWITTATTMTADALLPDSYFRHHPHDYLRKLAKFRHARQDLSLPHDHILEFLRYLTARGELEVYANKIIASGYRSLAPAETISSDFRDIR